jgi:hypothetical protein
MEQCVFGLLLIVVLLLVVMPALLYLVSWAAARFTRKPPPWLGFPDAGKKPGGNAGSQGGS